ncbi:MAG: dihydrodipicolinate synthase family protein [Verrucomicrobia bacterium]|nr:dihydrodipicolinate synthase family protein [Verrucomicrobiota bacterium]
MNHPTPKASATNSRVSGVLPVFQMPYHEDESIDFATLEREIDWLFDRGVDGVVMAMVSETLRLTDEERRKVAEFACKKTGQRGTVVISVGAESSFAACEHARHAAAVGATALMAIPPVSVGVSEDALRRYYERILAAVALPLVVQDASGYVGRPMSIQLQANLLKDFPGRVLFKPEATPIGPRLSALRDATKGQARIFEGSGGIALVDSFRRGVVGTMPGAEIIQAIVALWRALKAGDEKRAYELSLPVSSLVAVQNSLDAFLAVEKYLLVKQGVFKNTVIRGPTGYTLDEETRREVDRLFKLLQTSVAVS